MTLARPAPAECDGPREAEIMELRHRPRATISATIASAAFPGIEPSGQFARTVKTAHGARLTT